MAFKFYRYCVHMCTVRTYRPTCMTHKCKKKNEKVIEFMMNNVKSFDINEMRIYVINFGQKMCVGNSTKNVVRKVQYPQLSKYVVRVCFLLSSQFFNWITKKPNGDGGSAMFLFVDLKIMSDYDKASVSRAKLTKSWNLNNY